MQSVRVPTIAADSSFETTLSASSDEFELQKAEEAYSKLFGKDEDRTRFDTYIKALIGHHGTRIRDDYLLEACEAFSIELGTLRLLLKRFNKNTSTSVTMPSTVSLVHGSFARLGAFSKQGLPLDVQNLIGLVAQSEQAYDTAALSYGQALNNAFGPVKTWTGNPNFENYQLSILQNKVLCYLDDRIKCCKIPGNIEDKNEILGLLGRSKTQITEQYKALGPELYNTREALRKWISVAESRFMKKAMEAAVSAILLNN
jgi:hypothetical protein